MCDNTENTISVVWEFLKYLYERVTLLARMHRVLVLAQAQVGHAFLPVQLLREDAIPVGGL